MMHEFDIINRFCSFQTVKRADVLIETGDDCAVVQAPPDQDIAVTTDTLVAGVHFPLATSAYDLGHKALAVNLSDLAAMGASPAWATFALTLPEINAQWLDELAQGFFALATKYNVQLIGGDLTYGPLTLTLQVQGLLPKHSAIKRSGAKAGDLIYVTHTLGDAGLALQFLKNKIAVPEQYRSILLTKLNRPEPQVLIGEKLRHLASAAIDISDGLAGDLQHISKKSHVGAVINVDQLPLSKELLACVPREQAIALALNAGDDYELCFTIPTEKATLVETEFKAPLVTCIGRITEEQGCHYQYQNGSSYAQETQGYQHF